MAPSDAAADVILSRLLEHLAPASLFRLNWWQRTIASVPVATLSYCHQSDDMFDIPAFETLLTYRVIVTTCGVSGALRFSTMPLYFDVVIIDEASQATEGESLVPLAMCKPNGVMVLAGDIRQLGPVYRSPAYRDKDVHSSLQDRLLSSKTYMFLNTMMMNSEDATFERLLQSFVPGAHLAPIERQGMLGAFLYQNYRSNKSIFELSSRLLYADSLTQCGDEEELNSLIHWGELPNQQNFPVLTVGVEGQQKHLMDSPSYYNLEEGNKIVSLCVSLLTDANISGRVKESEIGVIAAFRQQVLLIRDLLRKSNLWSISVGSVEDFQGQEKKVILISTVLSKPMSIPEGDHIGLFGDYRRFNVAITRAIALVVVVGHPRALYKDPYFHLFLKFCAINNSYITYESLEATAQALDKSKEAALGEGCFTDNPEWRNML